MATVLHVPAFEDNYIWLIAADATAGASRPVIVVDPGDAEPTLDTVARLRLTPIAVLCTHHHGDHVAGIGELLARYPVPVYGPAHERIRELTHRLNDGDRVDFDDVGVSFTVLDVPGHTAGHVAYVGGDMLFCGDTLFSAGCGRLFEGTPDQMHRSLGRLAALPADTRVYCGHEYTAANLRFALRVEPGNGDISIHQKAVAELRAAGRPSLPSTIGLEQRINPFLRTRVADVRAAAESHARRPLLDAAAVFAALRRWKDDFRG